MKYDCVIFDLDGVLIDNSRGIIHCIDYVVSEMGLPELTEEQKRTFIGPSLKYSFHKWYNLSEDKTNEAVALYRKEYVSVGINIYELYPGVKETLETLSSAGAHLSLCTGKVLTSAEYILERSCIRSRFSRVCAFPSPPKDSSKDSLIAMCIDGKAPLMVGDRIFDITGAERNGIDSCYASYGFGNPGELSGHAPTHIINSIKELIQIVI